MNDSDEKNGVYILGFATLLLFFMLSMIFLINSGCLREKDIPKDFPDVVPTGEGIIYHTVQPGETLWRIARNYGIPLEVLARANGISDPTRINAGATLKVPASTGSNPATVDITDTAISQSSSDIKLNWPLKGTITRVFSPDDAHTGIDISAATGTLIRAAAEGKVAYSGDEFEGYGMMIIIEHSGGFSTLYAHCSELLVFEGDEVKQGHIIARVGSTGRATGSHLHFEVRKGDVPVDPTDYLQ